MQRRRLTRFIYLFALDSIRVPTRAQLNLDSQYTAVYFHRALTSHTHVIRERATRLGAPLLTYHGTRHKINNNNASKTHLVTSAECSFSKKYFNSVLIVEFNTQSVYRQFATVFRR